MSDLPVREIILYKHGVGFFVRGGVFAGEQLALTFRAEEINDILKSLTVIDRGGGQVLGIYYQTPMDKNARLANSSVRLRTESSVRDLLRDLRGRDVYLEVETMPDEVQEIQGRIIGIDDPYQNDNRQNMGTYTSEEVLLSVLVGENMVSVYPLHALRSLIIHDEQSEHDLQYFLDTSMQENIGRTVNVRLSAGDHQLAVSYVAPAPTWRVSYRIVAESEEDGESGRALLQGWGLFDNRLEEDLDNVKVTLVAGQPISFIYDLYSSRIPVRPVVQDESRVVSAPVEYQSTQAAPLAAKRTGGGSLLGRIEKGAPMMRRAPIEDNFVDLKARISQRLLDEIQLRGVSFNDIPAIQELYNTILAEENMVMSRSERQRLFDAIVAETLSGEMDNRLHMFGMSMDDAEEALPSAAEGKDAGEFFQYNVTTPVSVKRGESALVPIIGKEVGYQRELLYNENKLPDHPVASLRFQNNTGLTLERGPVTLVENSDYKGEAIIPFTKDGDEVYVPYAVELGIKITAQQRTEHQIVGLHIKNGYTVFERYRIDHVTYAIRNSTMQARVVTIEAEKHPAFELVDTPEPDAQTETERRWRVTAPAQTIVEFHHHERIKTQTQERVQSLTYERLSQYLQSRWLDQSTFDQLRVMLEKLDAVRQMKTEQTELNNERDSLYQEQEQIRENLKTLKAEGDEATLRKRMLDKLSGTQDRLEAIELQQGDLKTQIATTEAEVSAIIEGLG